MSPAILALVTPRNIGLAIDMVALLQRRISHYINGIKQAREEGRDISDSELDALSEAAKMAGELARTRIEALKVIRATITG